MYFDCKSNLDDVLRYANIHKINVGAFEEIMTDNIKNLKTYERYNYCH